MTGWEWFVLGIAIWLAVALVVALLVVASFRRAK